MIKIELRACLGLRALQEDIFLRDFSLRLCRFFLRVLRSLWTNSNTQRLEQGVAHGCEVHTGGDYKRDGTISLFL